MTKMIVIAATLASAVPAPVVPVRAQSQATLPEGDGKTLREYSLPNAKTTARRMAITADDAVWYADFSLGRIGRLDPKTGAIKEWPSPGGPQSQPYGMQALGGVVWYSEGGVSPNTLVRFDPRTEQFQTWVIPSGGGVVRDIKATPEGNLIFAGSAVNHVDLIRVK